MLKDRETIQLPPQDSISVTSNFETEKVWQFIDYNISGFPPYYQSIRGYLSAECLAMFKMICLQIGLIKSMVGLKNYREQTTILQLVGQKKKS